MLLILGFVWFVRTMMASKSSKPERQVQTVQMIRLPPPPPPPPDQPPPPPPEKTEEQLPKDEPEPAPDDEPPPPAQLGIDAEGSAGGDAFGLAARRGGSDLVGGGTGTAHVRLVYEPLEGCRARQADGGLPAAKVSRLSARFWIEPDGRIKQVKLATTTGNREIGQVHRGGAGFPWPVERLTAAGDAAAGQLEDRFPRLTGIEGDRCK